MSDEKEVGPDDVPGTETETEAVETGADDAVDSAAEHKAAEEPPVAEVQDV